MNMIEIIVEKPIIDYSNVKLPFFTNTPFKTTAVDIVRMYVLNSNSQQTNYPEGIVACEK